MAPARCALALSLAVAVGACTPACGREPPVRPSVLDSEAPIDATSDVVADAGDEASLSATPSELTPVAMTFGQGPSLNRLSDGTLLFTHGLSIDRLHADGRRTRFKTFAFPLDRRAFDVKLVVHGGSLAGGVRASLTTGYTSGRLLGQALVVRRDGSADAQPLGVLYRGIHPWSEGRLLALRVPARLPHTPPPPIPPQLAVVAGAAESTPEVPREMFVVSFVSFASGSVVALAGRRDEAWWHGATRLLRWTARGGAPEIERLPVPATARAREIVARAEDDVWIAGEQVADDVRTAVDPWLGHWDGRTWSIEPVSGRVISMSLARDGVLWVVLQGNNEQSKPNVLRERRIARDGVAQWRTVPMPSLKGLRFAGDGVHFSYFWTSLSWPHRGTSVEPDGGKFEPEQVVARAPGELWVIAKRQHTLDAVPELLLRRGGPSGPIVDVTDEDARSSVDVSQPTSARCELLFLTSPDVTADAVARVRTWAQGKQLVVVLARVDGRRVIAAPTTRTEAPKWSVAWQRLGLHPELRCVRPAVESLVSSWQVRGE